MVQSPLGGWLGPAAPPLPRRICPPAPSSPTRSGALPPRALWVWGAPRSEQQGFCRPALHGSCPGLSRVSAPRLTS